MKCIAVEPENAAIFKSVTEVNPKHIVQGIGYGLVPPHWDNEFVDFSKGDEMTSPNLNLPFKGLDLDEKVLRKIYAENAMNWFRGFFKLKSFI